MYRGKLSTAIPVLLGAGLSAATALANAAIEEIVVTAQKREQNLQDVGIAVSAFTGDALAQMGVQNLADVPQFIPGVELFDEYGSGQPTWVIRGVGLQDFNANNTPSAAVYIDDIYMTSNAMGGLSLFDLERVEVLKGPQGALYGRNTSGGAVRVLSVAPQLDTMEGYVSGSYGRWRDYAVEGAANLPLADSVALRLSARWNQGDEGWQYRVPDGREWGEKDLWALRGQLLWQISDRAELKIKIHSERDRSDTALGRSVGLYDPATGLFCDALLQGRRDNQSCVNLATLFDTISGQAPGPGLNSQSGNADRVLSNAYNTLDNEGQGVSAQLMLDFDRWTLTSITGYEAFDFSQRFDYDGSQRELGHQFGRSDIAAWSQELRLVSAGDGALNWLFGLEYAEDEFEEDRDLLWRDHLGMVVDNGLAGENRLGYRQDTQSWALYGQAEWQLADTWRVTLGARYTDEDKQYRDGGFSSTLTGLEELGLVPLFEGLRSDFDMQIWSGRLGLDWTPTDHFLGYASISRGFKAGGFYGGFPTEGAANIEPYNEETVWAYEIGFKSQWADDRLRVNGALFYYDYRDAQGFLTAFSDISNTVVTRLGNLGDAEHRGAELDLFWLLGEYLTLQAGLSWLEAEIVDSDAVVPNQLGELVSLEGQERSQAPTFSYSLMARYERPLGERYLGAIQLDYSWRDDFGGDALSIVEQALADAQEAYGLLNGRISLQPAGGPWEVAAWGRNLTDEAYVTNVTTDDLGSFMDLYGRPRSYGVDLTYHW